MKKNHILQLITALLMVTFVLAFSQSAAAQTKPRKKPIQSCIDQGNNHFKNKFGITRVIKSFDSRITSTKKHNGFLISVQKNLTYAILIQTS